MGDRAGAIPSLARRLIAAIAVCALALPASAQRLRDSEEIDQLQNVDITERLGESIPLDVTLTDSTGQTVTIADRLGNDKPAILALVYYDCPVVCSLVMDRLAQSLNELDYVVGRDFNVIVVSFDPTETTEQAFGRKQVYLSGYVHGSTPETMAGWTFHTGEAAEVRRLVRSTGWQVKRLDNGEYSHPIGLTIVSQDGLISRYLYGFDYPAKQLKLSLLEASEGKIARSLGERIMMFCYTYDPTAGAYTMQAMTVMRIGALLTVVLLTALIAGLLIAERARRRARRRREGVLGMSHADSAARPDAPAAPRRGPVTLGTTS